jgi:hypothetical protein
VFENGVSSGSNVDDAGVDNIVSEYLGWRFMVLSGVLSSRAVLARLYVNGTFAGVFVNVEAVDKRFLKARLGDDNGWLFKHSGGDGDGLKTHELDGLADPYEAYFCFWRMGGRCPIPSAADLAAMLPQKLDIPQMLRAGAVNAVIANTDGPLFKNNNYYWYDWAGGPRIYLPWDLDTSMGGSMNVLTGGVGGQTNIYTSVLFSNWRADYVEIVRELATKTLAGDVITSELARVEQLAGSALDADPYLAGNTAEALTRLRQYWTRRLNEVQQQIAGQ